MFEKIRDKNIVLKTKIEYDNGLDRILKSKSIFSKRVQSRMKTKWKIKSRFVERSKNTENAKQEQEEEEEEEVEINNITSEYVKPCLFQDRKGNCHEHALSNVRSILIKLCRENPGIEIKRLCASIPLLSKAQVSSVLNFMEKMEGEKFSQKNGNLSKHLMRIASEPSRLIRISLIRIRVMIPKK